MAESPVHFGFFEPFSLLTLTVTFGEVVSNSAEGRKNREVECPLVNAVANSKARKLA